MKEVSPLNTIKFIILAVIVLFSFPAPAEIYKYLDDQGNIHYTDDLNQVPLEQRDSIEASLEYDGDLDSDIDGAEAAPDEKENAALPEDQRRAVERWARTAFGRMAHVPVAALKRFASQSAGANGADTENGQAMERAG